MALDGETTQRKTVADLEAEVYALRRQLQLRDQALTILNRRLNKLEQSSFAHAGIQRAQEAVPGTAAYAAGGSAPAELIALRDDADALRAELERMRATKLFRWSRPARAVYARLRAPR